MQFDRAGQICSMVNMVRLCGNIAETNHENNVEIGSKDAELLQVFEVHLHFILNWLQT